jgi:hypothetical protein
MNYLIVYRLTLCNSKHSEAYRHCSQSYTGCNLKIKFC